MKLARDSGTRTDQPPLTLRDKNSNQALVCRALAELLDKPEAEFLPPGPLLRSIDTVVVGLLQHKASIIEHFTTEAEVTS